MGSAQAVSACPLSHLAECRALVSSPGGGADPTRLPSYVGLYHVVSVVIVVAKFTQKHFLGIAHSLVSARLPAVGHKRQLRTHLPGSQAG